ncbi:hypothetical protein J3459_010422 [Metarhizium acridum]|nr:hypothetical protein J3459_010422 [Metarhizium acridum]
MPRILVLNGPNLNLLGNREPQMYGSTTLSDIIATLTAQASSLSSTIESFQSNHEGALVDRIHQARGNIDAIIITPVPLRTLASPYAMPFLELTSPLWKCIFPMSTLEKSLEDIAT